MVRKPRGSSWLLAGGLLALASWLSPPVDSQDPSERPRGAKASKPDAPSGESRDGDHPEEPPASPSEQGEKPGTVPAPARAPGKEDEGPRPSPRDDELALRVLEIERAIWREIESVESRLQGIKERLRMLRGRNVEVLQLEDGLPERFLSPLFLGSGEARQRTAGPADPDVAVLPGDGILFSGSNDEISYLELLRRQDDVLRRWRRVVPPPDGRSARRPAAASGDKERAALREELRAILGDVLDLREKAREKQIQGLRREIDDIERAIDSRRQGAERGRLIERRLEDLLGPRTEPVRRRPPE